jgi:hypothetical protein
MLTGGVAGSGPYELHHADCLHERIKPMIVGAPFAALAHSHSSIEMILPSGDFFCVFPWTGTYKNQKQAKKIK